MNQRILFWASCIALVAVGMSFSIRGNIMTDFETKFVRPYVGADTAEAQASGEEHAQLIKQYLGIIAGTAFFSFFLVIVFGGPLVDLLGMGNLLRLAAVFHIVGSLLTIFAPNFWVVIAATLVIGAGNGLVEAVCNPLIATIYPEEKAHKLTVFHAWFPAGIVIGGLLSYLFGKVGLGWQAKMVMMLLPAIIYAVMILGQKFPATERVAAGLSFPEMVGSVIHPIFVVVFVVMAFTAATELGTGQWISNIYADVMGKSEGILALVWGSILMFILRQFFSKAVHQAFSPFALIALTAPFAAVGLFLFNFAAESKSPPLFFLAATLVYFGVCFWWPTMLGITSERCPRTGALGLALIGGMGNFATCISGPAIGRLNDTYGPARCLQIWAILPVVITVVFGLVYLNDLKRGGYKAERLATKE